MTDPTNATNPARDEHEKAVEAWRSAMEQEIRDRFVADDRLPESTYTLLGQAVQLMRALPAAVKVPEDVHYGAQLILQYWKGAANGSLQSDAVRLAQFIIGLADGASEPAESKPTAPPGLVEEASELCERLRDEDDDNHDDHVATALAIIYRLAKATPAPASSVLLEAAAAVRDTLLKAHYGTDREPLTEEQYDRVDDLLAVIAAEEAREPDLRDAKVAAFNDMAAECRDLKAKLASAATAHEGEKAWRQRGEKAEKERDDLKRQLAEAKANADRELLRANSMEQCAEKAESRDPDAKLRQLLADLEGWEGNFRGDAVPPDYIPRQTYRTGINRLLAEPAAKPATQQLGPLTDDEQVWLVKQEAIDKEGAKPADDAGGDDGPDADAIESMASMGYEPTEDLQENALRALCRRELARSGGKQC